MRSRAGDCSSQPSNGECSVYLVFHDIGPRELEMNGLERPFSRIGVQGAGTRTLTGVGFAVRRRKRQTSPSDSSLGALAPLPDVPLNLQHDRAMVVLPPGRFVLADSERALEIRAELPESKRCVAARQTRRAQRVFRGVPAPGSEIQRRRECSE